MRKNRILFFAVICLSAISTHLVAQAVDHSDVQTRDEKLGLRAPGKLTAIKVFSSTNKNVGEIVGRTDRIQLVVEGQYQTGQTRDLTDKVIYSVAPENVVSLDRSGLVTPLADGRATITATFTSSVEPKISATATISVNHFADPPRVNFPNEVVPLFTKHGCNGGGCHGKSGGQNGFALSLLGFEPQEDYQHLVKEARGRRVFPSAPAESLLLKKAIGAIPHGGGARIKESSDEYRLMKLWVEQGMPYGKESDPKLTGISIFPERAMMPLVASQQLKVTAHYTDGSARDVTRQAQFTANNTELAEATETGVVKTKGKPGMVAVMVRYNGQVDSFLGTVPLGAKVANLPAEKNLVDKFVFRQLKELGLPPSTVCDDSTFIRRVTLDIAGRLPTLQETRAFLESEVPSKREKLVDGLLESDGYANYFTQKWTAILRNKVVQNMDRSGNFLFHQWVRQSLKDNLPYDRFVTKLVTASGDVRRNPAVNWHRHLKNADERAEDTAQVFLGQRIQCAKCHHHPYEKWSQEDYWGFAAFYTNVNQKSQGKIYSRRGKAQARNPKNNQMVAARGLGATDAQIENGADARLALADWMTREGNPFFAKSLVNRYWKHFFGVGIVDPEDDIRGTNPATNPELLEELAQDFINNDFDLKNLIRTICNSTTYQLSSTPNPFNRADIQSFSKFNSRRLPAEVMLDCIDDFLGSESRFSGLPLGMAATEIPDHGGVRNPFLDVFGRPAGSSACECERSGEITMAQCLQLLNSSDMYNKLNSPRVTQLATDKTEFAEKIRNLYLQALSRYPSQDEIEVYSRYIKSAKPGQERAAYQDIVWAIVNTKEFMFNH